MAHTNQMESCACNATAVRVKKTFRGRGWPTFAA